MANHIEIPLWFPEDKLSALSAALEPTGSGVVKELESALEALYQRVVPEEKRIAIAEALVQEQQREAEERARKAAESYRVSAVRLGPEDGCQYWKLPRAWDILDMALFLRKALRSSEKDAGRYFEAELDQKEELSLSDFCALETACFQNRPSVNGVFAVDFDGQTFGFVKPNEGWRIYQAKDVSTAIYKANRKSYLPRAERLRRFFDALADKPYGPLKKEKQMISDNSAGVMRYDLMRFQNIPALFTTLRVRADSVPDGVYRYEIRADEETCAPCQLAKRIMVNHYGTLLTVDPIQLPADGYLAFEQTDLRPVSGKYVTLEEFRAENQPIGMDTMELFPAKPEEAPLFYSQMDEEKDWRLGCIGHVRGDFDHMLFTTWWPHVWDKEKNDADFQRDLDRVVAWLKTGFAPLKDLNTMEAFCRRYPESVIPNEEERPYGFRIETRRYRYMLRCTPLKGWYHVYLYCYAKDTAEGGGSGEHGA